MLEEIADAIENWVDNGKAIPPTMRRAVRENQALGCHAANFSRDLSLHFLTTSANNIFCLYHSRSDKKGGKVDGQDKEYQVVGIPFPRDANERKSDRKKRPAGHLHCGCNEDVALMDFFLWKNLEGESGGFTEGMKDKIMEPRMRCFVMTGGFNTFARIEVDDIFTNGRSSFKTRKAMIQNQIARLKKDLEKLEKRKERQEPMDNGEDTE
jgi:hypothetical protein